MKEDNYGLLSSLIPHPSSFLQTVPECRKHMTNPHSAAQRHLSRRDRVLKRIIPLAGDCVLRPQTDLFAALVRSIIAQQISTKAAQSISARLIAGPCGGTLTP